MYLLYCIINQRIRKGLHHVCNGIDVVMPHVMKVPSIKFRYNSVQWVKIRLIESPQCKEATTTKCLKFTMSNSAWRPVRVSLLSSSAAASKHPLSL